MIRAATKLLLLFGLYVTLSGQGSPDELTAAGLCALAAAALAVTIPRIAERHFAFRGVPWLRLGAGTAASLAGDLVRVGLRLARPAIPPGSFHRWPFAAGGEGRRDSARRGLVTVVASLAPNTYVVAVLIGRRELLVHRLAPAPPPRDRDWPQ
ncbi:MAG TPA: hypothetical protein VFN42_14820 [Acetobacteraceae bacterium]|nr:hypothetical protein [Acetobacteraceae bacterium]